MNRKIVSAFVAVSIVAFPNKHIRAYESTKIVRPKKITLGYERTLRSVKNIGSGRLKIEKHYVYELSDKEKNELQRIAYAEARGSGIKAMGLVMQVVMNRVKKYGSVHDVIFAPGQFEPVSNGMMSKAKTTASTSFKSISVAIGSAESPTIADCGALLVKRLTISSYFGVARKLSTATCAALGVF